MELRELFTDDDAVSPVIGVILMVAITVILAAVIATFVLGLGEQVSDTAPQASFTYDYDDTVTSGTTDDFAKDANAGDGSDGQLTITHAGGATLNADQLGISGAASQSGDRVTFGDTDTKYGDSSEISSGDGVDIWIASDDKVKVTWRNEQGTDSATLSDYDGPDA